MKDEGTSLRLKGSYDFVLFIESGRDMVGPILSMTERKRQLDAFLDLMMRSFRT